MNSFLMGLMNMGRVFYDADKGAAGGAAGDGKGASADGGSSGGGGTDLAAIVQGLKESNDRLMKEMAELKGAKPNQDKSLNDRVEEDRNNKAKKDSDNKALEQALTFTLKSHDFLKENESILPKEMGEIFKAAEKESYDSAVDKSNAIKAAMIQSFFKVQANIDILTPNQKTNLEDYLKLTKNGKEERAQLLFDNVFEPALLMVKSVKKAEEISRAKNGFGSSSSQDQAYKEKMMNLSKSHYLGEKGK